MRNLGHWMLAGVLAVTALPAAAILGGLDSLATLQDGVARRESSYDPYWEHGNSDMRRIEPGQTLVIADITGPGVINHIWNTISSPEAAHPRLLTLRMYWDGEKHPSVEAPLGDFFGIGHGLDIPFSSLPVAVSSNGKARNCYWPMPFHKSARITVTNDGHQAVGAFYYYVDWTKLAKLPKDTAYFHAQYRQEYPAAPDKRFLIADITGRGHYVGTVLSVRQRIDEWMGEGDDMFYVDGAKTPTLFGTGLEDYFCDAWGFREFSHPYYGVPLFEGYKAGDRTTAYRWHVADPVRFTKSLRVEIEHVGPTLTPGGGVEGYGIRPDDFASVAFWYQTEPHAAWEPIPTGYDRIYPKDYLADMANSPYVAWWVERLIVQGMLGAGRVEIGDGGEAVLNVTNPLPTDIVVEMTFPEYRGVTLQADTPTLRIPAGGTASTTIMAGSLEGAAPEELSAIPFTGTVTTTVGEGFQTDFQGSVLVEAPFRPHALRTAPKVDGNLDDWPALRFSVTTPAQVAGETSGWKGAGDCEWTMDAAVDDDYLYVAISVVDDTVLRNATGDPWLQDGVEIRMTALPGDAQRTSRGENELRTTLLLAVSPELADSGLLVWRKDDLPEGTHVATAITPSGYTVEAAIPVSWLDAQQGRAWESFRMNVAVNDIDDETHPVQLWWRPDWRGTRTYDGSGTFVRP